MPSRESKRQFMQSLLILFLIVTFFVFPLMTYVADPDVFHFRAKRIANFLLILFQ